MQFVERDSNQHAITISVEMLKSEIQCKSLQYGIGEGLLLGVRLGHSQEGGDGLATANTLTSPLPHYTFTTLC